MGCLQVFVVDERVSTFDFVLLMESSSRPCGKFIQTISKEGYHCLWRALAIIVPCLAACFPRQVSP